MRLCAAESLACWESKRFGQIYPDTFLPIAEKYLLMERLGEWILKAAGAQSLKPAKFAHVIQNCRKIAQAVGRDM